MFFLNVLKFKGVQSEWHRTPRTESNLGIKIVNNNNAIQRLLSISPKLQHGFKLPIKKISQKINESKKINQM